MKPKIHLAFDTLTIDETLQLLNTGIGDNVDIIECGGPLIFNEGVKAVTAIKKSYPEKEIVADIKMIPLLTKYNAQQFFRAGTDSMIIFGTESLRDMSLAVKVAKNAKKKFYFFVDLEPDTLPTQELLDLYQEAGVEHVIYHTVRDEAPYWKESDIKCVQMLCDAGFKTSVTGKLKPDDIFLFADMLVYSFIIGTSVIEAKNPSEILKKYQEGINKYFK